LKAYGAERFNQTFQQADPITKGTSIYVEHIRESITVNGETRLREWEARDYSP